MCFNIQDQKIILHIVAKPNAKKSAILKISEQGLHVSIHAKPHQGEANQALISFLSDLLDVPKSQIILKSGEGSKFKKILLPLTSTTETRLNDIVRTTQNKK